MKRCSRPGHEGPSPLPLEKFPRDAWCIDGRAAWCRACRKAYARSGADLNGLAGLGLTYRSP
jgi:hypothetical protein